MNNTTIKLFYFKLPIKKYILIVLLSRMKNLFNLLYLTELHIIIYFRLMLYQSIST